MGGHFSVDLAIRALYRIPVYIEDRYFRFDRYIESNVSVSNKISIIYKIKQINAEDAGFNN